jgi:hypothetical protein
MTEQLKTVIHRDNHEAYLFGYEQYYSFEELKDLWTNAMWMCKDFSSVPYGDFTPGDIINVTISNLGLLRPRHGSELEEYVLSEASWIVNAETEQQELIRRLGYDPDESESPGLPIEILRIGRK